MDDSISDDKCILSTSVTSGANNDLDSYLLSSDSEKNTTPEPDFIAPTIVRHPRSYLPPIENEYRSANLRVPTLPPLSITTTNSGNMAFEVVFSEERPSMSAKRKCLESRLSIRSSEVCTKFAFIVAVRLLLLLFQVIYMQCFFFHLGEEGTRNC